jgi:phosphohistidine phosphatase
MLAILYNKKKEKGVEENRKIVLLMRHAKSSWKQPYPDFDRTLKKRGKRDAKNVANRLKELNIIPNLIYSSPAKRAIKSAKIVAKNLNISNIKEDITLYEGDKNSILKKLKNLDEKYNKVLVVSHNPTISNLAYLLSKDKSFFDMPTAAIIAFEFKGKWKDLSFHSLNRLFTIIPKELRE